MTEQLPSSEESIPKPHINLSEYRDMIKGTELEPAFEKVIEISRLVEERGGKALLVGGCVRDLYIGAQTKDFDIEIYGLDYDEIRVLLPDTYHVSEVGKAFGIMKVFAEGIDLDLSVPRVDSKTGEGHAGFSVATDKHMSIKEAARRRDFTMNTLAMDPLSGEVYDDYGGISDLQKRLLRVTDDELFADDPLRVLRAMQFVGRFGLSVAEESKEILKKTAKSVHEVSKDRFFEEFKKLLTKSEKPSLGLMAAFELGIFEEFFPHFPVMKNTPQEPEWHPEGDVWTHTLMVVDEAAKIVRERELSEDERMVIMLSALLHDIGKPETTHVSDANRIVSPGHEEAGEAKTREFLEKIYASKEITEKVVRLVTQHMMPGSLYRAGQKGDTITASAIKRLAKKLHPATIDELIMVSSADSFGRGGSIEKETYHPGVWLKDQAERVGVDKKRAPNLLRGKDLIDAGLSPGKMFRHIINMGDRILALREMLAAVDTTVATEETKDDLLALIADLGQTEDAVAVLREEAQRTITRIREARSKTASEE